VSTRTIALTGRADEEELRDRLGRRVVDEAYVDAAVEAGHRASPPTRTSVLAKRGTLPCCVFICRANSMGPLATRLGVPERHARNGCGASWTRQSVG
jgi:hypothetical protein